MFFGQTYLDFWLDTYQIALVLTDTRLAGQVVANVARLLGPIDERRRRRAAAQLVLVEIRWLLAVILGPHKLLDCAEIA